MATSFNAEQILADFKNWNQQLKKYQVPNTRKAVVQILNSFSFYAGLWALQFYLYDKSVFFTIILAALNGLLLGRIFIIQHDCGHRSFTRSQIANDIIGTVCSVCTVIPYKYWAKSHDFHHAHNGQLEVSDVGDIKVLTSGEYNALGWKGKVGYRIYRSPYYLFTIGGFIYVVLYNRFAFLREGGFAKVKKSVTISNVIFVALYASLGYFLGFKKFMLVQFINLFFFGTYALWFFYIQHQYEDIYKNSKENWNYVLSAIKGSTYYRLPAVFNWLTGNIGFHHIHHLCPTIPNYNLKECHRNTPLFEKHVTVLGFRKSLQTVKANLWDAQEQRMISFSENRRRRNLIGA